MVEALAVTTGNPVPVMAARAVFLGSGWRAIIGALGLVAYNAGLHWPGQECQFLSVLVAAAGVTGPTWGGIMVCEAAWRWPAFPQDGAVPARGVRVNKWHVEVKPGKQSCTCFAASC